MTWLTTKVSDVLLESDSGLWGEQDNESGISVLRSTNMRSDGTIDFSNLAFRAIPVGKRKGKLLVPGDIILENSGGGPKQPVGRVCFFEGDTQDHVVGNFCRRLRSRQELVLPKFLFWNLFHAHATGETLRFQTQTTGIRNLQFRGYSKRPLSLPPISEQARIVDLLDEAERLRKVSRGVSTKAARIVPALFLKMFGDPVTNPRGLPKKALGNLLRVKSGAFLPAKKMVESGIHSVYGGNGVNGLHDEFMFEERKVVIGRVGAYCGVVHYSKPRSWITDNALYVSEVIELLDDHYLVAALEMANLNQYAGRAGQPLISGSRIYPVEILVPSEADQKSFALAASTVLKLNRQSELASTHLDQLWRALTQHAFSGQLTANWRTAHMQELVTEMQHQARLLKLTLPNSLEAST